MLKINFDEIRNGLSLKGSEPFRNLYLINFDSQIYWAEWLSIRLNILGKWVLKINFDEIRNGLQIKGSELFGNLKSINLKSLIS